MRIAETYRSVQGEGRLTGTDSIFIRTSGCNLRCVFCDTPYASWHPEGTDVSVDALLQDIHALIPKSASVASASGARVASGSGRTALATSLESCRHIVLTGGEPLLFDQSLSLCERLRAEGFHITIETAGTIYLPLACDLMSISPKTRNSLPDAATHPQWHQRHEETRFAPDVIRRMIDQYDYQIKFVVVARSDIAEILEWLASFPEIDPARVYLMPEGITTERLNKTTQWLQPECRDQGFQFCPRRQIEWFGNARRT